MVTKLKHFWRDCNQWSLLTVLVGLFIAIPIITILIYLFAGVGSMWQHIVSHFLFDYVKNSCILIIGTGIVSFLFGTSAAWIVCNYDFPFRKTLSWMLYLPLAIPSYIVAYAYVGLFGNGGTLIGFFQSIGFSVQKIEVMNIYGLVWVLSCSLYPYVYAGSRTMFRSIPSSIKDTAKLLGAFNKRYFFSVALPLASPAIVGGLFLVFMEVLNDYGAAKYYGINTFTTGIFRTWTMLEDLQSAIYLSALLVVIVFIINGSVKWQRGKKSYVLKNSLDTKNQEALTKLSSKKNILVYTILAFPLLFGFILPVGQLFYWTIQIFESMFNFELLNIALQSILLAVGTSLCILITALAMIFFSRWNYLKRLNIFKRIATIGYVIPGAIIGIGIIRSSQGVIDFFDDTINLQIGYLFYGSSVILIYAYTFRFLAVAYNPLEANSLKLGKYLYESSYLLKKSKLNTLWKIELPLLKPALVSAALLLFIDILKELPLTLILKPYKLQTLAVKAYEYADDERVAEAALPALVLILIICLLMTVLSILEK